MIQLKINNEKKPLNVKWSANEKEKHENFQPCINNKNHKLLPLLELRNTRNALLEAGASALELNYIDYF